MNPVIDYVTQLSDETLAELIEQAIGESRQRREVTCVALVAELLRRYLALKAVLSRLADGGPPGE